MSDSLQPPWTAAYQAPPSMGFSRQEYWSGLPDGAQGDCIGEAFENKDFFQRKAIYKPAFMRRPPALPQHWTGLWECSGLKCRREPYPTAVEGEPGRTSSVVMGLQPWVSPQKDMQNSCGHHRKKAVMTIKEAT